MLFYSTPIHSDDHIITFYLSVSLVDRSKKGSPQYVYNFGKRQLPWVVFYLCNQLLDIEKVEDMEEIWSNIKEVVPEIYFQNVRENEQSIPVWFNGHIKHQINYLRRKKSTTFSLQKSHCLQKAEDKLPLENANARVDYEGKLVTDLAASNDCSIYTVTKEI